jgi:hypothetical protein
MRPADRIVPVSVAVVPRDRPQGNLSRPIEVVASGRRIAARDQPVVSGLLRAGAVSAHPSTGAPAVLILAG